MKLVKFGVLAAFILLLACSETETIFETLDKTKMSPPLGLTSVTQNGQVTLFWYTSNYEKNFGGYYVFRATGDLSAQSADSALSAQFVKVDSLVFNTSNTSTSNLIFSDKVQSAVIKGLTNGTTYSFAVTAFNRKDKKEISYPSNIVAETPRPDIETVVLKSASTAQVTGDDSGADIINEAFDPGKAGDIRAWLAGMNGAGLQDLGYMQHLDGSDIAPEKGYSDEGKSIAVLLGHVYAVKTGGNKYGKLLITNIGGAPDYAITFNAAFQTKLGDRNYKQVPLNYKLGLKN